MWGKGITGNGVIKPWKEPVSDFKNVEVSGDIKVYVSQGPVKPVKIEGDENLLALSKSASPATVWK